uniref:Uncharacterized protein LOC107424212 isoform X1 n=1 Tax=Rhizophora mucronata TaxID=61149 RepID=A0A2P2JS58_RHIMU
MDYTTTADLQFMRLKYCFCRFSQCIS